MELKEIFPIRLKSARKMAGLSMDDLVGKMKNDISKSAIGKYELGKMLPDSKNLIALANALNVNVDYFFRPLNYKLINIEFRKKAKLQQAKQRQIKAKTLDYLERYIEIEELLNKRNNFINPLESNRISNLQDIEKVAVELRNKWNIGDSPILNLLDLLEDKGFKIFEVETSNDFEGLSAWAESIPVIVLNKNSDNLRKRFTALHEVAHLLLQFSDTNNEKLCHTFAGAFLMPAHILINELGAKRHSLALPELIAIKETFGISVQALVMRAKAVDIVNENYVKRFFIYVHKHHLQNENNWGKYSGIEQANRFNHLIYFAATEEIISLSKGANLAGEPLSEFRTKLNRR